MWYKTKLESFMQQIKGQVRIKGIKEFLLNIGSYSIWFVCSNAWRRVVWKIPKLHRFIPRSRCQKLLNYTPPKTVRTTKTHTQNKSKDKRNNIDTNIYVLVCMIRFALLVFALFHSEFFERNHIYKRGEWETYYIRRGIVVWDGVDWFVMCMDSKTWF